MADLIAKAFQQALHLIISGDPSVYATADLGYSIEMARSLAIQSTVVGSNLQSQWIKKAAASFHPNANINQLERIP